jgi:hypothetical protein
VTSGVGDVVTDIRNGMLDHGFDEIREAIRMRERRLAHEASYDLNEGDTIRIKGIGMGGKYLNGLLAVIDKVNPTTVWVRLTPESRAQVRGRRLGDAGKLKIPLTCVELAWTNGQSREALPKIGGGFKNVTPQDPDATARWNAPEEDL